MIIADFIHFNATGLYCPYGDFYLDPQQPVKNAVISHAHGDHAVSGNADVYCTAATHAVYADPLRKKRGQGIPCIRFSPKLLLLVRLKLHLIPAGHMLGSAQVMMEYEDVKYLYTGDYKLQPDASCEPYEFVKQMY
jgi:putative mRNA 3-end processing factor